MYDVVLRLPGAQEILRRDALPSNRAGLRDPGGDPTGTGQGGPGYSVVDAPPSDARYTRGVVAMAKTGAEPPGTAGLGDATEHPTRKITVLHMTVSP